MKDVRDLKPYQFPATKFVEVNSISKQMFHVGLEMIEVFKAVVRGNWSHCILECFDVIQAVETLIRLIAYRKGVCIREIDQIRCEMVAKNSRRGYYHG